MIPTVSLDMLEPLTALAPVLVAVASAALKGALLVALAAVVAATLLRHHSAAARHALWTGALAAHVVLVLATPFLPSITLPASRLPAWLNAGVITESPRGLGPVGAGPVYTAKTYPTVSHSSPEAPYPPISHWTVSPPAVQSPTASSSNTLSVPTTLPRTSHLAPRTAALWLLGVLLVLARLLLGTIRVHTLARAAERVTDPGWLSLAQRIANRLDIARPLTLLRGDRLDIPITWGVVYPVVLLPAESDEWPEERRRVVLVHEMAHVKRFDAFTQLVAQLAAAIFWFDPLVWLAARRMRAEREHACDDYVIRDGTRPSHYAYELLDMVRRLGRSSRSDTGSPAFAALAMARRSELEGRMLAILDPIADRHTLSRVGSLASALVALLLIVPLAALRPVDAATHEASRATAFVRTTAVPLTLPVERRNAAAVARAIASPSRAATTAGAAVSATVSASATLPTAAQEKLPIIYRCTRDDVRSKNSTYSMHSDTDRPGRTFVEYYVKKYGRCLHAVFVGPVAFTADERDVAALGATGRVQLHERTLDWERELVVTRDAAGRLQRVYTADGRPAAYDATAQAWVGRLMQDLARESGAGAPARVSRIRARGGVPAVLAEIDEIEGSGAKRKHYEALLESGGLSAGDIDLIVRHAGQELSGSSGDLRAVLRRVPATGTRTVTAALENAIGHMSDGDKHQVLAGMLDSADSPTLLVVLRLAEQIGSDGDKSTFLRRAVPRALGGPAPTLREAFFRTYATLGSDGDKHAVLVAALRQGQKSPALTRDVIRGSAKIGSDGEKAAVLLAVARDRLLVTDDLRDEYIKVARTIGSDGEYRQVIDAVLGGKSGG